MNRTDRLLAIVLELQRVGKGRRRAEDLAATFETSTRTIYRDMEALSEAGVPIVAVPGRGYALMAGYFLPPLSFRTDEATMLLLGADVMAQQFDAQYRAAAESAAAKIEGVLPESLRAEVRALRERIRFFAPGDPAEQETLLHLRRALLDRTTVRFRYTARSPSDRDPPPYREVDPYSLIHVSGEWLIAGYDHLRRDLRTFASTGSRISPRSNAGSSAHLRSRCGDRWKMTGRSSSASCSMPRLRAGCASRVPSTPSRRKKRRTGCSSR